jgi:ABC-type multidrug transport system permease subunit
LISVIAYYFIIGLELTVQQFFIHYLVFFLLSFYGTSAGLMLGSIVDDAKTGTVLVVMVIVTSIGFSGLIKNRLDFPKWCGWLEYFSPIKYGFIAIV